jgi:zinc protease
MQALDNPLIRFTGRKAPDDGARPSAPHGTRQPAPPLPTIMEPPPAPLYTDFGKPGVVVEDKREPHFAVRQIRFANGVRPDLKHQPVAAIGAGASGD